MRITNGRREGLGRVRIAFFGLDDPSAEFLLNRTVKHLCGESSPTEFNRRVLLESSIIDVVPRLGLEGKIACRSDIGKNFHILLRFSISLCFRLLDSFEKIGRMA